MTAVTAAVTGCLFQSRATWSGLVASNRVRGESALCPSPQHIGGGAQALNIVVEGPEMLAELSPHRYIADVGVRKQAPDGVAPSKEVVRAFRVAEHLDDLFQCLHLTAVHARTLGLSQRPQTGPLPSRRRRRRNRTHPVRPSAESLYRNSGRALLPA